MLYFSQRSDPWCIPWSDPRISKLSIDSLDILITLTLYKPVCPLSATEFCLRNGIYFLTQPRHTACKSALWSSRTVNASETSPKSSTWTHLSFVLQARRGPDTSRGSLTYTWIGLKCGRVEQATVSLALQRWPRPNGKTWIRNVEGQSPGFYLQDTFE